MNAYQKRRATAKAKRKAYVAQRRERRDTEYERDAARCEDAMRAAGLDVTLVVRRGRVYRVRESYLCFANELKKMTLIYDAKVNGVCDPEGEDDDEA